MPASRELKKTFASQWSSLSPLARYWNDIVYSGNKLDPALLKLPDQILSNQMHPGWPTIIMGEGMYQMGARFKWRVNDSYVLVPSFTKLAGSHNLRFGSEARLVNWNEDSPDTHAAGYFTFNTGFTQADPQQPNTSRTSGTSMASMLLGAPASGDISGPTPYTLRAYFFAAFVQDDWKIRRNLTLNFGSG